MLSPHPSFFPLYLLPTISFRRRRSSTESTSTTSTTSTESTPPKTPTYLSSQPAPSTLHCSKCLTHLLPTSSIISKGFTGRHGRAYLVSPPVPSTLYTPPSTLLPPSLLPAGEIPNTTVGRAVPRQLVTGAHTVADVSCRVCGSMLGWKYVRAEEEAQKYKVGKFILETKRVVRGTWWDGGSADGDDEVKEDKVDQETEFDSQDEDECEDLFSGVWSPALARRRRRERGGEM